MVTIHETSKRFGVIAKRDNRLSEKLVKLNPQFRKVKGELITLLGRC